MEEQQRDCETLGGHGLCHGTVQGVLWGCLPTPPVTFNTTSPTQGHPSTSLLSPSMTVCAAGHSQVPASASSLLLLGHHPCLVQSSSEVIHRHLLQGEGWERKLLLSSRGPSQQAAAVASSSLSISLIPLH